MYIKELMGHVHVRTSSVLPCVDIAITAPCFTAIPTSLFIHEMSFILAYMHFEFYTCIQKLAESEEPMHSTPLCNHLLPKSNGFSPS